ncbi:Hypothetical protein, putative [Bodo saltans]|uniref:Uncharacterized protein n=1 Tax=Bodo saltans TaxID=75058 RepID=A0A0S4JDC6_BODSA|nr:Hypothetical protein, putative [Bodo saltans]|eukprot:CUG88090.1 Hypothetical protein, putative [Bodo saltans]
MATSKSVVPTPPELDWGILSTLVHLSNADKIPLPMILKVAKDFSPSKNDEQRGANEGGARRSSRFFTISKRGRTIADFTSIHNEKLHSPQSAKSQQSSSYSPFQNRGGSANSTEEQARLPNYLVNPHSAVLFGTTAAQNKNSGRRQSTIATTRKRSSIFDLVTHMQLMKGAGHSNHEDTHEFRSSTFTRAGLNVQKLRNFEALSDERERTVRKQIAEESSGMKDDVNHESQLFSVSYVTPRLIARGGVDGEEVFDPKHPKQPECMRNLLERRQKLSSSPGPQNDHRETSEDVDWTGQQVHSIPHPPPPATTVEQRKGDVKRVTSPPLKRYELALVTQGPQSAPSTSLPSPHRENGAKCPPLTPKMPVPSYPMPPSPRRPQAHPMLRRNMKSKLLHPAAEGSSTSSPLNPFQDHSASFDSNHGTRSHREARGNNGSSYATSVGVRELGAEVALSGGGQHGRQLASEAYTLFDRVDSRAWS